ncbi:MAG TPA: DUF3455 domain-containing protein [Usitatibacter sp.]|nr:DUF3455 domain-containing protein [Usitatibacter sp.]
MHVAVTCVAATLAFASSQSRSVRSVPVVVAELMPPKDEVLLLRAFAEGVQIYECVRGEAALQWKFVAPEAELTDDLGHVIGTHYAGPTWESTDGSKVAGKVVSSVDAADPGAIPHLLIRASGHEGSGVFTKVRSIQRLQTNGGRAPAQACREADVGQKTRVRYHATYYFYGDAGAY